MAWNDDASTYLIGAFPRAATHLNSLNFTTNAGRAAPPWLPLQQRAQSPFISARSDTGAIVPS